MIVSKPAIIFYIGQIFFNFLAMACFAGVANFQAKWGVGPCMFKFGVSTLRRVTVVDDHLSAAGLSGFAVFISVSGIVLSSVMLAVPVLYEKYDKFSRLARAMKELRVAFILAGAGSSFTFLIAWVLHFQLLLQMLRVSSRFIVTVSAWTEPGCKNANNDPNAKLGDAFKNGLPGWCSTKKAGAIFFWLAFSTFPLLFSISLVFSMSSY